MDDWGSTPLVFEALRQLCLLALLLSDLCKEIGLAFWVLTISFCLYGQKTSPVSDYENDQMIITLLMNTS